MIGKTISHYKILEKLGEGGMGVVYEAQDTKLKRTVALKFISQGSVGDEEDKNRFVREAQAAAALDHPNICPVYEIEEAEGQTFIAMAYLDGQSLKEKIAAGPLKLAEALDKTIQVAQGLNEAHEKGIVHRDIKSANIMVSSKGQARIMDFGLAKQAGRSVLTKESTTLGTISYMSPEQTQGEEVDFRTDIWSLGVMIYEMITGQLPFKGEYDQAVVYSIINEDAEPPTSLRTGVPMELEMIVNKAMAKNPQERYQNVNDMIIDLRAVEKKLESAASKTGLSKTTRSMDERSISLFKDLLHRRVPQILGIYLAAGWGVIQFVDWLVNRYPISPNLPEFSLVTLASMVPTVLIISYFHGKPGRDRWTRIEKFGIPVNLVVSVLFLFILFHDRELGSATKTVSIKDDEGNMVERVIPKNEFRKKIALFFFDNETNDSTLNWLQYGIAAGIYSDIGQDILFDVRAGFGWEADLIKRVKKEGFTDGVGLPITLKKQIAKDLYRDYFISGSFLKEDKDFIIQISLYNTEPGRLLNKRSFSGENFTEIIDEITVQLKYDLNVPDYQIQGTQDLPVSELTTNSLLAFEFGMQGYYFKTFKNDIVKGIEFSEKAVNEDSTLVDAWMGLFYNYLYTNRRIKAENAMKMVMQNIYKYPEFGQLSVRALYYFYKNEKDKGVRVLETSVELFPDDLVAHEMLAVHYEKENQKDKAISEYKTMLNLSPSEYEYLQKIGGLYREMGKFSEALKYYKSYVSQFPVDYRSYTAIGQTYKEMGDLTEAKRFYEKAELFASENINILMNLAELDFRRGKFDGALTQYKNLLTKSKEIDDQKNLCEKLINFHETKGQIYKAIEYVEKIVNLSQNSIEKSVNSLWYYAPYLAKMGQREKALKMMHDLENKIPKEYSELTAYGYLFIYLELAEADSAEKYVYKAEKWAYSRGDLLSKIKIFKSLGEICEIRDDYKKAIDNYEKLLEMEPTNISAQIGIGRCYEKLKEYKKSEDALTRMLKIIPIHPEAQYELALVFWNIGKKGKALEHLKIAMQVWEEADPEYKPAQRAREKLNEWEKSE